MRTDVYAEEFTEEVEVVEKIGTMGRNNYAIRIYLDSHENLHYRTDPQTAKWDDDRSAITFWLPPILREDHDVRTMKRLAQNFMDAVLEIERRTKEKPEG